MPIEKRRSRAGLGVQEVVPFLVSLRNFRALKKENLHMSLQEW